MVTQKTIKNILQLFISKLIICRLFVVSKKKKRYRFIREKWEQQIENVSL